MAVHNCRLHVIFLLFTICSLYHITEIYSYLVLIFDVSRVPFQASTNSKLHCINLVYSSFAECCTQCNIITWRTGPTGPWDFQSLKYFSAFDEISYWTAEIQRSETKIFSSYWVTIRWYAIRIGLQLIQIYSLRMAFFLSWYDHEYC